MTAEHRFSAPNLTAHPSSSEQSPTSRSSHYRGPSIPPEIPMPAEEVRDSLRFVKASVRSIFESPEVVRLLYHARASRAADFENSWNPGKGPAEGVEIL